MYYKVLRTQHTCNNPTQKPRKTELYALRKILQEIIFFRLFRYLSFIQKTAAFAYSVRGSRYFIEYGLKFTQDMV